jgi:hypothetical protein
MWKSGAPKGLLMISKMIGVMIMAMMTTQGRMIMTVAMIVTFGEERRTECSCKVLAVPRCYKVKKGTQDRVRVNNLVAERDIEIRGVCKVHGTVCNAS